jgi:hypothetical protein
MASEPVRLASEALGPLLRKRGTSPALGASLRRAVQALDKALIEDDERVASESAIRAAKELQECLPLIRGSERPADHAQLEGITKVLSFLLPDAVAPAAPPVVELPAPVQATLKMVLPSPEPAPAPQVLPLPELVPALPPLSSLPLPPTRPPKPATTKPEQQPSAVQTTLNFPTIHLRVAGIQESLRLLHVVSRKHLATLADLEIANARMRKAFCAVGWLGPRRIPPFREVSAKCENSGRQVAAVLALGHLGDHQSIERLLDGLEKAAASKNWLPTHLLAALRLLAESKSLEVLLAFFRKTSSPALRALLLPVLAEREALPAGQLLDLAIDGDDQVAARAAESLAWAADAGEASLLFTWAMAAKTPLRANALLFSAAVLGSTTAVVEVRKRLAKPTMFVGYLADALAIAGDDSDVQHLLDSAADPNPDMTHILLAAANLGNTKTVHEFQDFDRQAPADVLEEVLRMILGSKGGHAQRPNTGSPEKGRRMLRGRPWSVAAVLDRLSEPDELLLSANRMALEIRVRTGVMPPCRLPLFTSATMRSDIIAKWRSHYAKADAKLAPGGWYYQGKPISKPDQKGATR